MVFSNLEKTDMVLIYGEVRGHSELARQIYGERFFQRIPTLKCTNDVQHLCDFGRFEMNKRDIGRQREDQILVAEEEILDEIENQPRTNHLGVSQFVVWLRVQNSAQEIRQNTGILKRVRLSWAPPPESCILHCKRWEVF
jgi:hypothetical protein